MGAGAVSLRQPLEQGDWVRATSTSGSVIEGQAAHQMKRIGPAKLMLVVGDDQGNRIPIEINVNFWDVDTTRRNLL